jgi:hypothetical protein
MDRRQFLELGGTSALALPLAGSIAWIEPTDGQRPLVRPDMLTRVGGHGLTRRLGRRYRRAFPGENDRATLTEILRRSAAGEEGPDLSVKLTSRVRREFAEGRTLILDGWVLARTEARQCALSSLLYS